MVKFTSYLGDEISVFVRSIRDAFWEVADRAERTRVRLRIRQEQCRLAEQEASLYRQLGFMGYGLLKDGVSVRPTPDTTRMIEEVTQLEAEQLAHEHRLAGELAECSPFEWRRLSRILEEGTGILSSVRIVQGASGCGRSPASETPPGFCVAVKRGDRVSPVPPGFLCREGDTLFIFGPASAVPEWRAWSGDTSTTTVD